MTDNRNNTEDQIDFENMG